MKRPIITISPRSCDVCPFISYNKEFMPQCGYRRGPQNIKDDRIVDPACPHLLKNKRKKRKNKRWSGETNETQDLLQTVENGWDFQWPGWDWVARQINSRHGNERSASACRHKYNKLHWECLRPEFKTNNP